MDLQQGLEEPVHYMDIPTLPFKEENVEDEPYSISADDEEIFELPESERESDVWLLRDCTGH